jgi:hypothetical protein
MIEQNKTLQIQVEELSSINSATKVQRLEPLLANERSVHDTMKTTLDLAVSKVEDCDVNGTAQTTAKAEILEASIVDLENSHTEDEAREDAQNKVIGLEALVESQHNLTEQFHCSKEENDKLKSAMLDLVTSNEENAQVISMLAREIAEKNCIIEKILIDSVTVLNSEARSDRNVEVDLTLDERDGVCVHSGKEETIVTVETPQGVNNPTANIEEKKYGSVDEITALKSILNDQLRLVVSNIEDLDLKNQNVDSSIKVNVQEINRSKFTPLPNLGWIGMRK